jgi:hypothetical protein
MNPLAQVRHVMAKDISQARWAILLYLVVVALATTHALGWMRFQNGGLDIAMFVVVAAGLFVTANIVQADSPIRSDAFWASRPLHPAAVLSAKALLVALLVLGAPLVGQAVVLYANEIPSAKFVRLVTESAWIYGIWLLIAMLVGALTRDLRSFTTTLIGAPVVMVLLSAVSMFVRKATTPTSLVTVRLVSVVFVLVGLVGASALLVALYRTRTAGKWTWLGAILAGTASFAAIYVAPPTAVAATQQQTTSPSDAAEFFIELVDYPNSPPQITLGVSRIGNSDRLVTLDSVQLKLRVADGTTLEIPHRFVAIPITRPRLLGADSVEWLGTSQYAAPETRSGVQITRRQAEQLRKGIVSATVEGRTWAVEPRVLFTLPFRTGQTMRRDGRTVRIMVAARTVDDSLGTVSTTTIERSRTLQTVDEYRRAWGTPQYVLVNHAEHQAVLPNANMNGSGSASLVLPGAWKSERWSSLQWFARNPPVDDAWLGNATLAVLDWTYVGDATISVNATVRPPMGLNEGVRRPPATGTAQATGLLRIRSP